MSHEIIVRLQADHADPKKFAQGLRAFADYLDGQGEVPKELKYKNDGIVGQLELQATMSHINAIERKLRDDLAKVEARLNNPATPEADKKQLRLLQQDLQAAIEGIEAGEDEDDHTIKAW
jgi:hypothetical protein